jgi:hypothetical protein
MTEPLSGMLKVEAMRLARLEVKHRLRDQGLRMKDYEARELTQLAECWLKFHKAELLGLATIGLLLCSNNSSTTNSRRKAKEVSHG